jgi:HD-GYP domain-containing protein (c-di-GMP phosphodiesterase class II)
VFCSPLSPLDAWNLINALLSRRTLTENNRELMTEIVRHRNQKQQLITIGTALSSHNNFNKLLSLILSESRDLVGADAGSIYLREKCAPGGQFIDALRFKISQNDSVDVSQAAEFVIPMNTETIAGYVATTGEPLTIDDVYCLPASAPYKFGKDWDAKLGYRVKSMLTIPLKNLAGEAVGVLQLMNKKKDKKERIAVDTYGETVMSFTVSDEDFMASIGSQAAVSIERVQLYGEIEAIFEGYLKSSVAAIDERDKITYGHSRRVMGYAMAFADAINAAKSGPFKDVSFSEARKNQFRFAALLHDIGKIGVPEALLMKETRLSKEAMALVHARAEYIELSIKTAARGAALPWNCVGELDADIAFLEAINHSGFLKDDELTRLNSIRAKWYFDGDDQRLPFLSDKEWESLSVRSGNLTNEERGRINSHAVATRRILSRIPWTKELERIPDIACHHHERIDGSGYPDGLVGEQICLESRALAVIDIFEALVAQDRPYKPKMPPDKAIAILRSEARAGHIDSDIVEFFVNSEIYKIFFLDKQTDEDSLDRQPSAFL